MKQQNALVVSIFYWLPVSSMMLNPYDWLKDMLSHNIQEVPINKIKDLLPHNWKKNRQQTTQTHKQN